MALDHEEKIRARAYQIWEREGRPHGLDREHWAEAERELASHSERGASTSGGGSERDLGSVAGPVGRAGAGSGSGVASGLQPGGVRPGGGPAGTTQGSVGTGGGSTAGRPSGSAADRSR